MQKKRASGGTAATTGSDLRHQCLAGTTVFRRPVALVLRWPVPGVGGRYGFRPGAPTGWNRLAQGRGAQRPAPALARTAASLPAVPDGDSGAMFVPASRPVPGLTRTNARTSSPDRTPSGSVVRPARTRPTQPAVTPSTRRRPARAGRSTRPGRPGRRPAHAALATSPRPTNQLPPGDAARGSPGGGPARAAAASTAKARRTLRAGTIVEMVIDEGVGGISSRASLRGTVDGPVRGHGWTMTRREQHSRPPRHRSRRVPPYRAWVQAWGRPHAACLTRGLPCPSSLTGWVPTRVQSSS